MSGFALVDGARSATLERMVSAGHRGVRNWLVAVYAMIGAMVVIGGITRLTGSGLSMVEWRPLMGALPPLSEADWLAVFEKYQASPQYQQVNHWMGLADFKRIFFWEWFHRLWGRLIGLVFFVPWLVFVLRGRLKGDLLRRTAIAFVLGGLQGLLGWFMVKSGLVDEPQVSHFRLAAHLSLAFAVSAYVLWLALDLTFPAALEPKDPAAQGVRRAVWAALALLTVQIVWGAFMAGARAGYLFSSFPDLDGHFWPHAFIEGAVTLETWLHHPAAIHFVHRNLGYVVAGAFVAVWWFGRSRAASPRAQFGLKLMGVGVLAQFALGVATVVTKVHLHTAVVHQAGAFALLACAVFTAHALRR